MSEHIHPIQNVTNAWESLVKFPGSIMTHVKLLLDRWVTRNSRQEIKALRNTHKMFFKTGIQTRTGKDEKKVVGSFPITIFQKGDWVRIRTVDEIEATLDHKGQLKGCAFVPGMQNYCGTVQRVLKPVDRFVDEREYQVKRSSDLYILEGLMCQGTNITGICDRSCLFLWRGEWLEKQD